MDWFRHDVGMAKHPKMIALAKALKQHRMKVYGHLSSLLEGVAEHAESGVLVVGGELDHVEVWAEWDGPPGAFIAALQTTGWIDDDGELVGWWKRHRNVINDRKRKADKRKCARTNRGQSADSPKPDLTRPDPTRHPVSDETDARAPAPATPPAEPAKAPAGFSSGFWENDATRADRERLVESALAGGLETYAPDVAAEVERVATAQRKTKPQKYASGMLKKPERLRAVAVRLQSERAERIEKSSRAGPPAAVGPPPSGRTWHEVTGKVGGPSPGEERREREAAERELEISARASALVASLGEGMSVRGKKG